MLQRNHDALKAERSPLYNFIYSASTGTNKLVDEAVKTLEDWPMELINWTVHNSQRHDIEYRTDRGVRKVELKHVLPVEERSMMKWNGNPWEPDGGDDGRTEDDGSAWLIAYWMGRAHGFISATAK